MGEVSYRLKKTNNVEKPGEIAGEIDENRKVVFDTASYAVNVDFSKKSGFDSRLGTTRIISGNYHSGWSNPARPLEEYVVSGTSLLRRTDTVTQVMATVTANLRMAFCQVNDLIVYSNGVDFGVIEAGVVVPAVPTLDEYFAPMAQGEFMTFYNGRLYCLKNNIPERPDIAIVYCSAPLDTPGGVEVMDTRHCEVAVLDGPGTMLAKVEDGLYVSAGGETFFLGGSDILTANADGTGKSDGFDFKYIGPHSAISGMYVEVKASVLNTGLGMAKAAVVWGNNRGQICIGGSGGKVYINEEFVFPPGQRGSMVLREQAGQYHIVGAVLESTDAPNKYAL